MTRPKIWKDTRFGALPWCATNPYKPAVYGLCATWEEAREYIEERLANPFPLELDRRGEEPLEVTYHYNLVWIDDWRYNSRIALKPHHWRPLARALTRLADLEGVK
ncbi:hypothetical protein [uncultured Corynebacterium sp.]|uniref:hypothetical protein n=1 Tax=uncultured Corynebacterium sp. TaxID=159447 RepID=UPI002596C93C|nr:hypothetical protein [uncultured Corynebacterium sp.]